MSIKIDVDRLAHDLLYGKRSLRFLPTDVYHFNANHLTKALVDGLGVPIQKIEYNSPDWNMLKFMRGNIFMFSAAKTFQQTAEMSALLVDKNATRDFKEFKKEVGKISHVYNENHLKSEVNTATASSQSASAWEEFENEKLIIPYLRYSTIGDACPICAPLNGITLPVNHWFWGRHNVPNHFNCMCILEGETESSGVARESIAESLDKHLAPLKDPMFQTNVGRTQTVFNKKHPYFNVPLEYKEFAKLNFGLDIPPMTKENLTNPWKK